MSQSVQKAFYYYTYKRYELLTPNVFIGNNEMDFCGIHKGSGYLDEIEMKVTKSDFQADFKKTSRVNVDKTFCIRNKHQSLINGDLVTNYFSFLIPEELQKEVEIPEYAGLYLFSKNKRGDYIIKEVKKPKLLHKNKVGESLKYQLARKMAYRYWDEIK